jgi:hypothetical protein
MVMVNLAGRCHLEAQYWGSKLGISGLEVINRQREAAGMRPLITPASMEIMSTAMTSDMRALLNRLPTYNRSVRALSSMGSFQPAMVPKGSWRHQYRRLQRPMVLILQSLLVC